MEPGFYRGDILFLTNPRGSPGDVDGPRYEVGDITVYKLPSGGIPIVHRVLETHEIAPNATFVPHKYNRAYVACMSCHREA